MVAGVLMHSGRGGGLSDMFGGAGSTALGSTAGGTTVASGATLVVAGALATQGKLAAPELFVIALIGFATAIGLVPVPGPRDFYGGLVLLMLPTLALIASAELPGQRGFATITLAHITFSMVYVTTIIQARLSEQDRAIEEAGNGDYQDYVFVLDNVTAVP